MSRSLHAPANSRSTPMAPPNSSKKKSSTTPSAKLVASTSLGSSVSKLFSSYSRETPTSLKLIDVYLVFILLTGIFQFVYMLAVGTFPYNSFLAGFISTVGSFVLTANLRIQTNPRNAQDFKRISPERAFADFVFASVMLHFFVVNYIG
ncbi:uncharacterized protein VTP21DRAFT_5230 [Calcarisporiella thermophila]|uniref:uncharacterized protein n=1 Tax=Calcarisporiella thermophila TaxID=911321 RepID=UPI003744B066